MDWTTVATAFAASVGGAWLTAALALRNARRGRWWEKKAAAYERVIAAIEELHFEATEQLGSLVGHRGGGDVLRGEEENRSASRRELKRTLNTATLLLSVEAMPVLNGHLARERRHEDPVVEVEGDILASGDCMARLIRIPRADLGLRPLERERFPGESTRAYRRRRLGMFFEGRKRKT